MLQMHRANHSRQPCDEYLRPPAPVLGTLTSGGVGVPINLLEVRARVWARTGADRGAGDRGAGQAQQPTPALLLLPRRRLQTIGY